MVAWWVQLEVRGRLEVDVVSAWVVLALEARQSDGQHLQSVDPYSGAQWLNYGIKVGLGGLWCCVVWVGRVG
jgi:hypothetical protein